eukprot:UN03061
MFSSRYYKFIIFVIVINFTSPVSFKIPFLLIFLTSFLVCGSLFFVFIFSFPTLLNCSTKLI